MTPSKPNNIQTNNCFGDFNYQPILSNYYNFLNDDDDDGDDIPGSPVFDSLPDN